jgi:hypothetical protein
MQDFRHAGFFIGLLCVSFTLSALPIISSACILSKSTSLSFRQSFAGQGVQAVVTIWTVHRICFN